MKLVKNFVFTVVLVSTLAVNTMAGETQIPGYVPPPPPKLCVENDDDPVTPVTGTDAQQTGTETADNLLYEALAALLSLY